MILMILAIILLVSLVGGGIGHSRYGYVGWSPAGLIIAVLVICWATGNLHFR